MSVLDPALKNRIEDLIRSDRVVLFMKGTREAPRCGFSARVVDILDEYLPAYVTVDVLADPALREGVKAFSDWPTLPQLYIDGEFIGGADITAEMHASGGLSSKLGVAKLPPTGTVPRVTLTAAAAAALRAARDKEPPEHRFLRLTVSARFQHRLSFGPALPDDTATTSEGIEIRVDKASAKRADGVVIDFVDGTTAGFRIDNPNAPATVKPLSVKELAARLERARADGVPFLLFDVRTPEELAIARIEGARPFDDAGRAMIEALPRDTPIAFVCHHGGRSQAAAEHWLKRGFREVYNVVGGIDAWSLEVDPRVPRY